MTPEIEARLRTAHPDQRDAAIIDAHREGATIRQICALVGLSPGGVHKILKRNEKPT